MCYGIALGFVMLTLTAVTLAINPLFYTVIFGPFPVKPRYVDYATELFGMVSHVAAAALIVWAVERLILRPDERR